ncbi:MAG TPA: acetate--CoA ligase family protein [Longimicrobiales bacterium]|nr:acetate--CoA ligase family protein [Longimicrobiales bacterium]
MSTTTEPVVTAEHSLDPVVRPGSIAIIGCSRKRGTIGYQIVDNLLDHGYTGALHLINPNVRAVHSIPTRASVLDVEGPVDLAVITVPKELVLGVAEECGAKGVRALVVITAGFKEIGPAGAERERALRDVARRYGMRLVGPNCLGVLNTDPAVSMNATFAPVMPPPGPVSFMSQSGAMGVTILDYAAEYGIGINQFISVGNKADISGNDLIEYWAADPATRVILMYLENFGNPKKFARIAREVTRHKPIIAVKSGRTASGARAASSHTGALAGLDSAIDALLAQYGVIRVDTVEELFDLAMAFSLLPLPEGDRVAIITNAGGPGIIIADACEAAGLRVTELSAGTQQALRAYLPEEASVRNPVDMIASATADHYRRALIEVLQDDAVDGAIAAFVPPLGVSQRDVAAAIVEARRAFPGKPILAVLMGREGLPQGRAELKEVGVPAYIFPESAARALAAMVRYSRWVRRPVGTVVEYEMHDDVIARIIAAQRAAGGGYLSTDDARTVLRAAGIPVVESRLATTAEEAVAAATTLGLPVVLKVVSPDIVHKTDVGGVELDLRTTDDVRAAFDRIMQRVRSSAPDAAIEGVLVEQYVRGGRETIIGMSLDPGFGPVLMFGLGGIHVEALRDVVFRVHPLTDLDAREMTHQIRGVRLLDGIRGEPPADREMLAETIQRVSRLVGKHPEIVELDINPFVVFESGGTAVDARIRITGE